MFEMSWKLAATALVGAVGFDVDISVARKPERLGDVLRGCGLSVRRVPLINHILPSGEGQVGYLLERADGMWLPVLGNGYEASLLDVAGTALRPIDTEDLMSVTHALVFTESTASMAQIMPFLSRYKGRFAEIFMCGLIVNLFGLTLPLFSSFVYDKILGNGITETLWALVIGLGIIVVVEFCVRLVRVMVAERFAISSEADIDHSTFRNLLDTRANALPGIGSLLEKYKQVLNYRDFLSSSYLLALADLPFLLVFLLVIMVVSGPLVLVSIVCGGMMLASSVIFTMPVLDYDRLARRASERRFGLITDLLTAHEAVIGSAMRNELFRRWRQASVTAITTSSLARYWRNLGMTMTGSISYLSYIAVLVGGVYMVEDRTLTSGGLLAASMLTSRTMAGFSSISTLVIRYREFRTALRELNQVIPAGQSSSRMSHGALRGAVRLDKVTCRLRQGDHPVLNSINLSIEPGEMVGIAGAPGAGKTTLLRLLAGVLTPNEGRVLIDDIPFESLSPEDLTQNIGFKPQDLCLLDGTIEDNVRAGRPALTVDQRQEVLMGSGLIRGFHDGGLTWATDIGSRGSSLSGGQRQLVALARAMLCNPPLLLLDEPTNGLDAQLEAHLVQQLVLRKGQSTILVSSHSRTMLSVCDRIIVVGKSGIMADGPRERILA